MIQRGRVRCGVDSEVVAFQLLGWAFSDNSLYNAVVLRVVDANVHKIAVAEATPFGFWPLACMSKAPGLPPLCSGSVMAACACLLDPGTLRWGSPSQPTEYIYNSMRAYPDTDVLPLQVAMTHPMAVTNCNIDMESLITDQNRSIATLAITTLLKTGEACRQAAAGR